MAYIGKTPITGNFVKLDAISVVNGQAAYTMNNGGSAFTDYENVNQFLVSLNGILQSPTTSFTVSSSTLTFASNLATGDVIDFVIVLGNTLDIGTPSDATVTQAKTNFVSTSSSAGLQIKGDGTTAGALQLNCEANSHGIKLQSPPHSANQSYSLKFPSGNVTAGKFLKIDSVSGSGTTGIGTMTFADAGGGDFIKLSSTTPSAANTLSIDGFFTSDYDVYKIYVIGISGSSMSNTRVSMRVNVGGSAQTGSNHYYHTNIQTGSSINGNWSNSTGQGYSDLGYAHNSSGSTAQAQLELTIFRPLATDMTSILQNGVFADNGTGWGRYSGFTTWKVATAISGITLGVGAFGSGNIEADRILVYGLKI